MNTGISEESRVEDDFLITDNGYRLLGNGLIKTVEEIENYRAEHWSLIQIRSMKNIKN